MYIDIKQILHSLRINYTSIPPGYMITLPPFPKKNKLLSPKNNVSENVWSRYQWNYVIANSKQLILVDAWYYESTIDNILEMCKERDQNRYVSSLLHH